MKKLFGVLILLLGAAVSIFRSKSKQHEAEAKMHKDRADQQLVVNETQSRIDNNLTEVEKKHREQEIADENSLAAGRRNHLDNSW